LKKSVVICRATGDLNHAAPVGCGPFLKIGWYEVNVVGSDFDIGPLLRRVNPSAASSHALLIAPTWLTGECKTVYESERSWLQSLGRA
jgi:hypothetical protein